MTESISPFFSQAINHELIMTRVGFREELDRRLDGRVWKSPDIPVAKDVVLQNGGPAKYIPIALPDLGPFTGLPLAVLSYGVSSTRSRFEQLGVDVSHGAGQLIAETFRDDGTASVLVTNHCARPIRIRKGTGVFRLYVEPFAKSAAEPSVHLEGKDLLEAIQKEKIQISGKKGKDWDIMYDHESLQAGALLSDVEEYEHLWGKAFPVDIDKAKFLYEGDEAAWGIKLRLDPRKRMWIPPNPKNRPIEISGESGIDYRAKIDSYLKPIPRTKFPIHWIGETRSYVRMANGINAEIERNPSSDGANLSLGANHANSLLIDGGFESTIRTEIISSTAREIPKYIFLRLFRDKR